MTKSENINLWSAMTSLKGRDLASSDAAEKVVKMADTTCGFASELSLEVDEHGTWRVRLFSHDDNNHGFVELALNRHGSVTVTRDMPLSSGVSEKRSINMA